MFSHKKLWTSRYIFRYNSVSGCFVKQFWFNKIYVKKKLDGHLVKLSRICKTVHNS